MANKGDQKKPDYTKLKAICAQIRKLAQASKAEKGGVAAAKMGGMMPCLAEFAKCAAAAARLQVTNAAL